MIHSFLIVLVLVNWLKTSSVLADAQRNGILADKDRLTSFALLSLSIVDITTGGTIVSNLVNGDTTCLSPDQLSSKSLTVVAITTAGTNGTIAFDWDYGDIVRVESRPPYAFAGTTNDPHQPIYHAANSLTMPGDHILTVRVAQNALSFPTTSSMCINRSRREQLFDEEGMECSSVKAVSEITIQIKVSACLSGVPNTSSNQGAKQEVTTQGSPSDSDLPSRLLSARNVVEIRGELKQWQKITLLFNGPIGSERGGTMPIPYGTRAPNLFADYLFQMEFRHAATGTSLSIPGHFAANGHAATTGAVSGHVWACHFRPPLSGVWQYTAHFKYGIDIARSDLGINSTTTAYFFDGHSGVLHITDGGSEHKIVASLNSYEYHRWSHSSESHITLPANTHVFDSMDFDGYKECRTRTTTDSRTLENWKAPHHGENTSTTQQGSTTNLLYSWDLSSEKPKGLDSMAMIQQMFTQNDTHLILPLLFQAANSFISPFVCQKSMKQAISHELAVFSSPDSPSRSNTCGDVKPNEAEETNTLFSEVIETDKTRIDVSKTEQWSMVLDWATEQWGATLQLQLEDESTAHVLDNGSSSLGPQRRLYYREVVARFGHYRDLIWDLGHLGKKTEHRQYLATIDPYQHVIL